MVTSSCPFASRIWLLLDQHEEQVAAGITRTHAMARIDAIVAANPSLAQLSERNTLERT